MIEDTITDLKNNWLYQSNKLIESSYKLTVLEQKLLRILASTITKDDKDFQEYKFNQGQLQKILGITNKRFYKDLEKVVSLLMQRIIRVKFNDKDDFQIYHFIEVAKYQKGTLTLKINPEMRIFYINLDWYTKYQIKNILSFKSTYSFRIYELLKQYENLKERILTIEELRFKLDIDKNDYPMYANFKQKIILTTKKELAEKTDIFFDFTEIKTGRKVTAIKFYIKSNKPEVVFRATSSEKETEDTTEKEDKINVLEDVKEESNQNIEMIKKIIKRSTGQELSNKTANQIYVCAAKHENYGDKALELIIEVAEYSKTQNITTNFVGWFQRTVKSYIPPKKVLKSASNGHFNDYEQRQYDFPNLEKRLLGEVAMDQEQQIKMDLEQIESDESDWRLELQKSRMLPE